MGEVVQFRDYQNPKDIERMNAAFEKEAIEIANIAFPSVYGFEDAVANTFHAPTKDPA